MQLRRPMIMQQFFGGGSAVGLIIILVLSLTIGETIANTYLTKVLIGIGLVLLIAFFILLLYSQNLKNDYEAAERRVKELEEK